MEMKTIILHLLCVLIVAVETIGKYLNIILNIIAEVITLRLHWNSEFHQRISKKLPL